MSSGAPAARALLFATPLWRERQGPMRPASTMRVERSGGGGPPAGRSGDRLSSLPRRVGERMLAHDAASVAAGMAYFAFLSLPPTLLVLFALTGFFGGEAVATWVTAVLTGALPADAATWIDTFVENVVRTRAPGPFSVGLVLALWAASAVFVAVARALNLAYGIEESRSFVRLRAVAMGVMLLFVLFFLVGSTMLLAGPQLAAVLGLEGVAARAWPVAQWLVPVALVFGSFWIAYAILPAREQRRRLRQVVAGAALATLAWLLATAGFRFYIASFGAYNETYGVMGGIIILMLWLYLSMLVILLGGELAAELEARAGS